MGVLDGYYSVYEDVSGDGKVIRIRDGVVTLQDAQFASIPEIEEASVPGSVEYLGPATFYNCAGLRSVTIGSGVREIGYQAFFDCSSLRSVTIPASVEDIDDTAFTGCDALEEFVTEPGGRFVSRGKYLYDTRDSAVVKYLPSAAKGTVVLEEDVLRLRDDSFYGCSDMRSLETRAEYVEMSHRAFGRCHSLAYIGKKFTARSRDGKTLIYCPPNTPMTRFSDPSLKRIASFAFMDCTGVSEVVLPRGLVELEPMALSCFPGLRTLSIEKGLDCDLGLMLLSEDGKVLKGRKAAGRTYRTDDGNIFCCVGEYAPVPDKPVPPGGSAPRPGEDDDDDGYEGRGRGRVTLFEPVFVDDCGLDDVSGMEQVKEELRNRLLLPVERRDLFEEYGLKTSSGILMYGPPGNGKTMLARAVAGELGAAFFSVTPSDILARWVGDEERNVRALFRNAHRYERSVIFFDDFDAIGKRRGNRREPWIDSLIAQLLIEMQGIPTYDGTLIVLAATNRPWVLDPALMRSGRFSTRIAVPLPDAAAREGIFRHELDGVPCGEIDYAALAGLTEGYSGADITNVCEKAKMSRVLAVAAGAAGGLTMEDMEGAVSAAPPSVDPRDLENFAAFERSGEAPDEEATGQTVFRPVSVEGCSLADVCGMEAVKAEFRNRVVLPAENPGVFEKYGLETSDGVLMYGPPGNGKTMLARAVAGELDAAFFNVTPSDVLSMWVGNVEKNIRNLFRAARRHERAVIFFDDFDAIGRKRGNERQPWMDSLIPELLIQMQGLERHGGTLIVLAATNRPWALDPALMRSGRFSTRIYVPLPDAEAREGIFERALGPVPHADLDFAALAGRTEGYSGADIAKACERAKLSRAVKAVSGEDPGMTAADLEEAIAATQPTVSRRDVEEMERYARTGEGPARGNEDTYVPGKAPREGYL